MDKAEVDIRPLHLQHTGYWIGIDLCLFFKQYDADREGNEWKISVKFEKEGM